MVSFIAELTSVVVLWLRGRALLCAALFWMGFHVFTVAILYIHFAPDRRLLARLRPAGACWVPGLRGSKPGGGKRAGRGAAGHPVPVAGDQPVDGRG